MSTNKGDSTKAKYVDPNSDIDDDSAGADNPGEDNTLQLDIRNGVDKPIVHSSYSKLQNKKLRLIGEEIVKNKIIQTSNCVPIKTSTLDQGTRTPNCVPVTSAILNRGSLTEHRSEEESSSGLVELSEISDTEADLLSRQISSELGLVKHDQAISTSVSSELRLVKPDQAISTSVLSYRTRREIPGMNQIQETILPLLNYHQHHYYQIYVFAFRGSTGKTGYLQYLSTLNLRSNIPNQSQSYASHTTSVMQSSTPHNM